MHYFTTATGDNSFRRAIDENTEEFLNKLNSPNSIGSVDRKYICGKSPQNIGFNILHFQAVIFLFYAGSLWCEV